VNSTSSSPEDVPPPRESRPQGRTLGWVSALLVGIALGGVGLILVARHTQLPLWSRLLGRNTGLDVSQLAVVNQIQQLQRLETVVYSMDKIVSGEKENAILPDFLAGDRLLMLVHGEVVAGVDFARLNSGDVTVEGKHVRLHLPEAQVLDPTGQRAHTGLLAADGMAGAGRSKPGDQGAAGGGTPDSAGGAHGRNSENSASECADDADRSAARARVYECGVSLAFSVLRLSQLWPRVRLRNPALVMTTQNMQVLRFAPNTATLGTDLRGG
jgi:Protein of unknown function (DUF4230)